MIQAPYEPQEREVGDLNEFLEFLSKEERKQKLDKAIKSKAREASTQTSTRRPLTREESEYADEQFALLRAEAANLRKEVKDIVGRIDEAIANGPELSLDISDKPLLKKAVRKVFGYNSNLITYGMYKEVLAMKRAHEKTELADYLENPK